MFRNAEVRRFAAVFVFVCAVFLALGWLFGGPVCALMLALLSLVLAVLFYVVTRARYRRLRELASKVDAALFGERGVSFDSMREGEVAILSSEIGKMVSRLNLAADSLHEQNEALADSLADISHQLKTPMTSLSINTELMRKQLLDAREGLDARGVRELLDRLHTCQGLQGRVEWLVAALLRLARLDAGVVKMAHVPVFVSSIVRTVTDTLAIPADLADVSLVVDVDEDASFVGDPSWATEALLNVVKNCLEHAGAGGTVSVCARQDALACRIRVCDTGPGFREEDIAHVFDRFYRSGQDPEASSEVAPAGVGIGLALARSLISAQNGTITAHNLEDEDGHVMGARFEIVFFSLTV
ncbi:MAG: HAMP domain-containing sensor histidine kinase [Coriobacteriaceae bacterium]|nr:HAMP domain-containing sensor histidine kinase [Coriobacteriaceae bacterium]